MQIDIDAEEFVRLQLATQQPLKNINEGQRIHILNLQTTNATNNEEIEKLTREIADLKHDKEILESVKAELTTCVEARGRYIDKLNADIDKLQGKKKK